MSRNTREPPLKVTISGPPGSGKTALAQIIARAAGEAGMGVILRYLSTGPGAGDDTINTPESALVRTPETSKDPNALAGRRVIIFEGVAPAEQAKSHGIMRDEFGEPTKGKTEI